MISPHAPIRTSWLARHDEPILDPGQPIIDAHHHLWDRAESRYRTEAFLADVGTGHNIVASLYVQCRTGYRTEGPEALRPLGEVETILEWSANAPHHPAGLVAFADLMAGTAVRETLEALQEIAPGKVRGVRNSTAYHPDPAVRSNAVPAPDGLLRSSAFLQGAAELARAGLVLDVWAYQTQLHDVAALARALPTLTLVVNHCGGPLGVGPFKERTLADRHAWRTGLEAVAQAPNTRLKVGGFGLTVFGNDYPTRPLPPDSATLAADWAPYVETCLDVFGPARLMFESNFPVDKGMFSYATLWNAFKRLAAALSHDERQHLFWRTATATYGLDVDNLPGLGARH